MRKTKVSDKLNFFLILFRHPNWDGDHVYLHLRLSNVDSQLWLCKAQNENKLLTKIKAAMSGNWTSCEIAVSEKVCCDQLKLLAHRYYAVQFLAPCIHS